MNRLKLAIAITAVIVWTGTAFAQHEHGTHPPQDKDKNPSNEQAKESKAPRCPIMDEPVDFTVKTLTADGPVYFCCKDCIEKYEKNPAKYAKQVAMQREALKKLERVQVACPISGKPVNGKTHATVGGRQVEFCCKDCIAIYEKDPAKHQAKLEASYTYQTKCPISGEEIDPTAFVDLPTGQRVYVCCDHCRKKMSEDPAKYVSKLEAQGVHVDVKKLKQEKPAHDEHAGHGHPR